MRSAPGFAAEAAVYRSGSSYFMGAAYGLDSGILPAVAVSPFPSCGQGESNCGWVLSCSYTCWAFLQCGFRCGLYPVCKNLSTDPGNCGFCGKVCASPNTCVSGKCMYLGNNCGGHSCNQGDGCCSDQCTPLDSATNCGACGSGCKDGTTCCGGCCCHGNCVHPSTSTCCGKLGQDPTDPTRCYMGDNAPCM